MEKSGSDIGQKDWNQDSAKRKQQQADEGRAGVKCKLKDKG
jgi:hypothetical protein